MPTVAENTQLLIQAAQLGDAAEVQRLIPLSDPKEDDSLALRVAAFNGHTQCVQLLLEVSDPKAKNSLALRLAVQNGYTQCVKLLIPASEPKVLNSWALQWAALKDHTLCVEMLYHVSDPVVALNILQKDYPDDYSKWGQLQEMVDVERVREALNAEVGTATAIKVQRKM